MHSICVHVCVCFILDPTKDIIGSVGPRAGNTKFPALDGVLAQPRNKSWSPIVVRQYGNIYTLMVHDPYGRGGGRNERVPQQ